MNYIHQLRQEVAYQRERADSLERQVRDFLNFINTADKFKGVGPNGERKDWISTQDVACRLVEMPSAALKSADDMAAAYQATVKVAA